jgi:hypothetical protein
MISRTIRFSVVFVSLITVMAASAAAQTSARTPEQIKRDALEWLDGFAGLQVLFHPDDVKKLRDRVAAMTPEEAAAWWERTTPQRKILFSPEWSETETWLRRFLRVQARYSDEEIRQLQAEAAVKAKDSPASLQEVLDRITQARRNLISGSQAAEQTRQLQVAANQAYRQEEVRQREEARRLANAPAAPIVPGPAPRREYRPGFQQPFIDGLDVARWTVMRDLFPRW